MKFSACLTRLGEDMGDISEERLHESHLKQQEYWEEIKEKKRERYQRWQRVQESGELFLDNLLRHEDDSLIRRSLSNFLTAANHVLDEFGDLWYILTQVKKNSKNPEHDSEELGKREIKELPHPRSGI